MNPHVILAMRESERQRWFEAAFAYNSRAIINRAVAVECLVAGFHEAAAHFLQKAIFFGSAGTKCYNKMQILTHRIKSL